MNKWMTGTMVVGGLLAAHGVAQAQSSVQVYGLLSAGIGYVSDEGNGSRTHALSGTNQNPRIGFRGQEDLGNGTKAVFVLENGFNVMTGTASQSGRLFGRQSYVGLSSNDKGTLTLGRQYEAVKDLLGPVVIASNGVHIGDNDNGYNNLRVQNAHKLTEALNLGASYFFTTGKYDVINKTPKWHQVNFQADYFLSKRTDVAVTWSYQKAAGDATFARVFGFGASGGKTQSVLIVGMRHYF